jgi:hypothetical protein
VSSFMRAIEASQWLKYRDLGPITATGSNQGFSIEADQVTSSTNEPAARKKAGAK